METRIYSGSRNTRRIGDRAVVGYEIQSGGRTYAGGPLVPEAPAHFGWGHDIGGARHLAYVLLRDASGSAAIAELHAPRFAKDHVTTWHEDWRISQDEIMEWLAATIPSVSVAVASPGAFIDGFVEVPVPKNRAVRTYRGERNNDGVTVTVTHVAGGESTVYPLSIEQSQRLRRHSPEINWGFRGGASLQLALALLLDATDRISLSTANYTVFAAQHVSQWKKDKWEITSEEILRWLAGNGGFLSRAEEEVRHG